MIRINFKKTKLGYGFVCWEWYVRTHTKNKYVLPSQNGQNRFAYIAQVQYRYTAKSKDDWLSSYPDFTTMSSVRRERHIPFNWIVIRYPSLSRANGASLVAGTRPNWWWLLRAVASMCNANNFRVYKMQIVNVTHTDGCQSLRPKVAMVKTQCRNEMIGGATVTLDPARTLLLLLLLLLLQRSCLSTPCDP